MTTERLPIIHPGEILKLDFLEPLNITPYRLSVDIGVAQTRVSGLLMVNAALAQIRRFDCPVILATVPNFG
jgi:antitoxin HigA-1